MTLSMLGRLQRKSRSLSRILTMLDIWVVTMSTLLLMGSRTVMNRLMIALPNRLNRLNRQLSSNSLMNRLLERLLRGMLCQSILRMLSKSAGILLLLANVSC